MPATIRAFRFRNKFDVVTSGGEDCGMMQEGLEFPELEFPDLESDFKKSA